MTSTEEKIYVKVPSFDGRKSKWPFFKSKLKSYMAQKNLGELLTFTGDIEKDSKTWTAQELQTEAEKKKYDLREMNRKAAGLL